MRINGIHFYPLPFVLKFLICILRRDVKQLAKNLISRFGSLAKVINARAEDLAEFGVAGEIGRTFELNRSWNIEPSVGLRYTQINFDGAEDNVGKKYDWDDVKYVEAEVSVALNREFAQGRIYVKPGVLQTATDGDSVKITGLDSTSTTKDMTLGRIEIGGRYDLTENISGYGLVHYTVGSDYDSFSATLGLNYRW
jgi:outer membrane autotransporter protein